jgi:hypothetical protein
LSGAGVTPIGWVRFEQDVGGVVFSPGEWFTTTHVSRSGGSEAGTRVAGAMVMVPFTGRGVRVIGTRQQARGIAHIEIDGVDHGTVDLYAPSFRPQQVLFEIVGLEDGEHTLVITHTGQANPVVSVSDPMINLDAIEAEGMPTG